MKFWIFPHNQIINVSPQEMGYKHPVLIRITSRKKENGELNYLPLEHKEEFKDILHLSFDDVFLELIEDMQKAGKQYKPITKEDAELVKNFYEKHQDNVDGFFVHCDAGLSRSAAVAFSLMEKQKQFRLLEKVLAIRRFIPNHSVWETMRNSLGTNGEHPYDNLLAEYKKLNIALHKQGLHKNLFFDAKD